MRSIRTRIGRGLIVCLCAACAIGGFYPSTAAGQDAHTSKLVSIDDGFAELNLAIVSQDIAALNALQAQGVTLSSLAPAQAVLLFHRAVRQGSGGVVEALLDMGAAIEAKDARGYTPLMLALEAGNAEAAYMLKLRGASLAVRANNGDTAEYLASILGLGGFEKPASTKRTVELVNADTALLLAAELGDAESMSFALAAGADPAARARNNWSAMMLAALSANEEALAVIVEALSAKGPDGALADAERSMREIDLDPILAAIIGQGGAGKDHQRAKKAVDYIARAVYGKQWDPKRGERYDKSARELGYIDFSAGLHFDSGHNGVISLEDAHSSRRYERFLPPLEYDLPSGQGAGAAGWTEVQQALREALGVNLVLTGRPDDETLKALAAYLMPVARLLRERAIEARRRAEDEAAIDIGQRPDGNHYGETHSSMKNYTGELHSSTGSVRPAGYVEAWSNISRKLNIYKEYHFYTAGDTPDAPSCKVVDAIDKPKNYYMTCKLLDREVTLQQNDGNSFSVGIIKSGQDDARLTVEG